MDTQISTTHPAAIPDTPGPSTCIICGGGVSRHLYSVSDTNQDVPGRWWILQCAACGTARLDPFPSLSEIDGFYRDVFYTETGQRFRPWMEALRARLGAWRGRELNRLAPERGRLLDIGAGAGHFAAAQRRLGWSVETIEPYNSDTSPATEGKTGTFHIPHPDAAFEAVTLWYVIEHLPDPRVAIQECRRVLKPDGILVLAQQDFSSVQARIFKENWLFLDPPRHLYQFAPGNLAELARQEGFRTETLRHSSLEMGPFTILQSLLNLLLGNRNDLFRYLKSRKLMAALPAATPTWRVAASLALCTVLGPLSLLAYWLLLAVKSGDVFTLYLRRS